jgi:hypothetical protein
MNIQINSFSYGNYGNQYQDEEPPRPEITVAIQVTTPVYEEVELPTGDCPDWVCNIL